VKESQITRIGEEEKEALQMRDIYSGQHYLGTHGVR